MRMVHVSVKWHLRDVQDARQFPLRVYVSREHLHRRFEISILYGMTIIRRLSFSNLAEWDYETPTKTT